jgi:CRP-like cAMP-binding protein
VKEAFLMSIDRPVAPSAPPKGAPLAERLRHFVPFRNLLMEDAEQLATLVETVDLAENEDVVQEGDTMEALYLVLEGSTAVFRDRVGYPVVLLRRLYPGDMFGHVALYSNGRHASTVRTS